MGFAPGLILVDSALGLSPLYTGSNGRSGRLDLLVAPLAAAPKFKGMERGALGWTRAL